MSDVAPLPKLDVKDLDHLGLLSELWDDLGFSEVVDACIPADEQVGLAPSVVLKALCLNLTCGRDALYRIQSFFSQVPLDLLLGRDVRVEQLNDDALGRHLDRLFHSAGSQLFNSLGLRVIDREKLSLDRLHGDTTSKLVFGEYAYEDESAVSITYGHSKDHRPDLKQVMAGMTTTREGIPVLADMLDGSQSDKTWHKSVLDHLRKRLHIPLDGELHYVGDSALITRPNLDIASQRHIALTGRLPRTVAACGELVQEAIRLGKWESLGAVAASNDAARYEAQRFEREVLGHMLQVGVYRSSAPNSRAEDSVRARQRGALEKVRREAKELMKRTYSCEADAERDRLRFVSAHQEELLVLKGQVVRRRVEGKYPRKGRPSAGEKRPVTEEIALEIQVESDVARAEQAIRDESCFVLVHSGKRPLTAREILEAYKGQAVVETRFPFLKDALFADVFFVKMPQRVEALGYVMMISLLLWSVWERRVRHALAESREAPLKDVTRMKKSNPTAMVCLHIMKGVRVMRMKSGGLYSEWQLASDLTPEQMRVTRFTKTAPKLAG